MVAQEVAPAALVIQMEGGARAAAVIAISRGVRATAGLGALVDAPPVAFDADALALGQAAGDGALIGPSARLVVDAASASGAHDEVEVRVADLGRAALRR